MREFVEIMAKALVDSPDEVLALQKGKKNTCVIELRVAKDDVGKVIGRDGRLARAIIIILKGCRVNRKRSPVGEMTSGQVVLEITGS